MEFISAEEFLKQPVEIQKVFLDWWKPSIGDLIYISHFKVDGIEVDNDPIVYALKDRYDCRTAKEDTPLFTEGQIRRFIEDKTGGKIRIIELDGVNYNVIGEHKTFVNVDSDLFQAYWKVALEIAKECEPNEQSRVN